MYANTRNNPIEDVESHLPLRVHRYELRDDGCPPGKWRGGIGSIREVEYLEDGGISVEGEGHKYAPWGFDGGSDGKTAAMAFTRGDGSTVALPSKLPNLAAKAGDRVVVTGPCGGGYGDPFTRDPQRVLNDVLDGHTSVALARSQYGVVLDPARGVDDRATAELRAAKATGAAT